MSGDLQVTIYYFYEGAAADVDNIVKPIHDALIGLVYGDDHQVSESIIRRRNLSGPYRIQDLTPVLAERLDRRREFLYVVIEDARAGGELV